MYRRKGKDDKLSIGNQIQIPGTQSMSLCKSKFHAWYSWVLKHLLHVNAHALEFSEES